MNENFILIWDKALNIIKEEISPIGYQTYIEVMIPRLIDEHTICLLAPSEYHIETCKNKYLDLLQNSLNFITKKMYDITFESKTLIPSIDKKVEKESINENVIHAKNIGNKIEEVYFNTNLNVKYTFENYVIGSNNRFAHAAAIAVKDAPGSKYNPLYIYGGVGLGKTHLMQAIGNEIINIDHSKRVLYVPGETFVNELISSIMNDKNEVFRNKYRNIDVLLIDDIQILAGKDKCQEEFFHTFNALFEAGKQIVLSSEKPPKDITSLDDRIKTRCAMGLSVDIQTPDYETRLAILRKKTLNEKLIIKDDVLVKIANKVKSNVRELEGVFNKLVAYSSFTNNDLTDQVVDNTIESILVKSSKVMSSKLIKQVVCKFFDIKENEIISTKRPNNISYPRHIAMYLCRDIANMTFPQIGKDFGGRDHSTALTAYGKIKILYETSQETKNIIDELTKKLELNN